MDHKAAKAELRNKILAMRDGLDPVKRLEFGLDACGHGSQAIPFDPGTVISGFFPIRSEIDPRPLMDGFRQKGARLCVPIVKDKTTIVFRELVRGAELVDTGFGTTGPGPEAQELDPDILLMPLSVFDKNGGRIGYGAGHYDRAISRLIAKGREPRLIGFAFSLQEVDQVPVEDHDQAMEAVITENGVINCKQ
ncbi:MAG: 5-formyltetrahydrofolate cyclo-ligase [Salaquimonas sp.]